MPRTKPPFRADHVGSLLRPAALKAARARHECGEITAAELAAIEDSEIERVVRKQEDVGLRSVTDGEFPPRVLELRPFSASSTASKLIWASARSSSKVRNQADDAARHRQAWRLHAASDDRAFQVRAVAHQGDAENDDPVAVVAAFPLRRVRGAGGDLSRDGRLLPDLGKSYRKAVRAFADAGCRYLQLDEVNFTYLCDPELRKHVTQRGDDPAQMPHIYARMINAAISDIPADMTITMHLCRGNFQSTFVASGGYEPVAEILFNEIKVDGYFMEYDSARAGGFEPLRFVPKDKTVVLGLVTSKSGTLESKDELKRRIDEAAKFVNIDQLCLSPQCGFASTEEGNILTEEQQWAKLRMIVELSDDVWGR
jgi:5-methyltetrahydropteroyltriglutamate--homocysteine methyltransferase